MLLGTGLRVGDIPDRTKICGSYQWKVDVAAAIWQNTTMNMHWIAERHPMETSPTTANRFDISESYPLSLETAQNMGHPVKKCRLTPFPV